jgi:hypothetical protein
MLLIFSKDFLPDKHWTSLEIVKHTAYILHIIATSFVYLTIAVVRMYTEL